MSRYEIELGNVIEYFLKVSRLTHEEVYNLTMKTVGN